MNAGRELDALVAEKVMGYEVNREGYTGYLPSFSTDIAAAWDVVEKLDLFSPGSGLYLVGSGNEWRVFHSLGEGETELWCDGVSALHAICLAALKAVGVAV